VAEPVKATINYLLIEPVNKKANGHFDRLNDLRVMPPAASVDIKNALTPLVGGG